MIDLACLAVVGIVVWCVASEGIWGATQTFLCVLLSGLLAMNYFEPLASFLDGTLGSYKSYSDIVALVGLFIAFVFALRLGVVPSRDLECVRGPVGTDVDDLVEVTGIMFSSNVEITSGDIGDLPNWRHVPF